jgi:thymidylate synthase
MLKNVVRDSIGDGPEESQYIRLIRDILEEGEMVEGRNGAAKTVFGASMYFSLEGNVVPVLTTKRVAWKTCIRELFWFIRGATSNTQLKENNVRIWNANGSREFLDSRGLSHLKEDDLGPVYGHQWRFFNADYKDCDTDYTGKGVDQLQYIIDQLKDPSRRNSRRLLLSAWNPCQLDEMALPPCHVLMQFNVIGRKLSCSLYQRSGDVGLGVPFNIASYGFLTHIIAHHCGLDAHEFVYHLGNAHIYDDHLSALAEQCKLEPYEFPTVTIADREYAGIEDYGEKDITLNGYESHGPIKMEMRK